MSFATAVTNPIMTNLAGHRDVELADLGSYFTARTGTPGTGIIGGGSVQLFTETTPILVLYNPGPYSVYPMSLRTHLTVVGSNATPTIDNWTTTIDIGNRYSSGGTQLTIQNQSGPTFMNSNAFVFVGAITATAATAKRRVVGHFTAKADDEADGGLEVVHDTQTISWGDTFAGSTYGTRANTTTPCYSNHSQPPIVVGPNCSLVIVRWSATQVTGSTLEYQLSWAEK